MNDKGFAKEVKCSFAKFNTLCDEAKENHDTLMGLLPKGEVEKHEMWFKVKMFSVDDFCVAVNNWLVQNESCKQTEGVAINNEEVNLEPHESISNVQANAASTKSAGRKSNTSKNSKSSSSVRLQAEAERAALMARAAALQENHALEEQVEQLRRKQEQLKIETELAASAAKLAVLNTSRPSSVSNAHSDGMDSYFKRGTTLNPHAETYNPQQKDTSQQRYSLSANTHATQEKTMDMDKNKNVQQASKLDQQATSYQSDLYSADQQATHVQDNAQASGDLFNLLQRQNEITALLVKTQNAHFLPHREIPVFDGNPMQYRSFIRAFEQCVEAKTTNKGDCLYYLEQFTRGQPKDLVRSCQHMMPDRGYAVAKDLLQEHFGHELKVTAAYMDKLIAWTAITAEDVKGLQAYSLFLRECYNAMEDLRYLNELNMPANMKTIIQKLPYKLREKWRVTVCDISETQQRRSGFKDIVKFIEYELKIISDPIFGDIQDTHVVNKGGIKTKVQQKITVTTKEFCNCCIYA